LQERKKWIIGGWKGNGKYAGGHKRLLKLAAGALDEKVPSEEGHFCRGERKPKEEL